jgi:NosR/NirI family transcriptional regulator, nitrous oxide reductase regulator
LSQTNPTVRLAAALESQDPVVAQNMSVELEAFRSSGTNPEDLVKQADTIRRQFKTGGWWLGGILGSIFGIALLKVSVRRSRVGYEPDRGDCLSCARCYRSCPKEHERLGIVGVEGDRE